LGVVLIEGFRIPFGLSFDQWAFMDAGGNLTAQYLIQQGYRPAIDFGYLYGLLPLLVCRLWFSVEGATPVACIILISLLNLSIGWAFARLALHLRLTACGIFLLSVAMPYAVQAIYPNIAHALEAALLANALAEQAAGRRAASLALAAAACLTKPSMGYFYGALLLGFAVLDFASRSRLNLNALRRLLAPALITAFALGAILGLVYGRVSLSRTLLPTVGMKTYQARSTLVFSRPVASSGTFRESISATTPAL
jgi:hypothetical protein